MRVSFVQRIVSPRTTAGPHLQRISDARPFQSIGCDAIHNFDVQKATIVIFEPTPLPGLLLVRPRRHQDVRGGFSRLWCETAFAAAGVPFRPSQISVSTNRIAGTLRGLHWQAAPHGETKLVRASRGTIFDVAVDLRADSPGFRRWFGLELTAAAQDALLVPPGFAHGFITLSDGAEVTYAIDVPFAPSAARGARYDDPALGIVWPRAPAVISERDLAWPALDSRARQPSAA